MPPARQGTVASTVTAFALLLVVAGGGSPSGQGRSVPEPGSIRGRVLDRSGAPIRSAEVRLRPEEGRDDRLFSTGPDGTFEIADLTPGAWRLSASKAGFITQAYGQVHPRDVAQPLKLAAGQRLTADIVLLRGGAITGQVLDQFGDPLGGIRVWAMRRRETQGKPRLVDGGAADTTDDTGAFRLFGLVPGAYMVSAVVPRAGRNDGEETRIYHGSGDDPENAVTIPVQAGEETPGVILSVPPPPSSLVTVSGQVLREDGAPLAGGLIHLVQRTTELLPRNLGRAYALDREGRFRFEEVPPGAYAVTAASTPMGGDRAGSRAVLPVDVGSTDLQDVTVLLSPTRQVALTVVTDRGQPLPRQLSMRLSLESDDGAVSGSIVTSDVRARPPLELPPLWGRQTLSAKTDTVGWYVTRIEAAGAPLVDGILDAATLPLSAVVQIVVTDRAGQIAGTLQQNNRPRRGSVVVFADDPLKWTYPSPYVLKTKSDDAGKFTLPGLPPGTYLAVAMSYLEPDEETDPAFLKSVRTAATAFAIREGEQRLLNLLVLER